MVWFLICQDEYLNLATLEHRLHILIKRLPSSNHNQSFSHANSSQSTGTMIPTPGLQQAGNSNVTGNPCVDGCPVVNNISNTIASSSTNSGNFLPTGNGSSGHVQGDSLSSPDGTFSLMIYGIDFDLPLNSFLTHLFF